MSGEQPDRREVERIALDELRRVRDRPPPTDLSWAGCATAVVAIIAVVLMPFVGRAFDLPGPTMGWIGLGLLATAAVGMAFGIFGGGLLQGREAARIEGAIDEVIAAHQRGDLEERTRACVRLLDSAFGFTGPGTTPVLDPDHGRDRLGASLPHVLEIEILLVERQEIYPVFTPRSLP